VGMHWRYAASKGIVYEGRGRNIMIRLFDMSIYIIMVVGVATVMVVIIT
jgi:hypothetical protein